MLRSSQWTPLQLRERPQDFPCVGGVSAGITADVAVRRCVGPNRSPIEVCACVTACLLPALLLCSSFPGGSQKAAAAAPGSCECDPPAWAALPLF